MENRYFVNIEPIEPSGVVLTVEALPRLLIFGESPEDALHRAREAIGFRLRASLQHVDRPLVEIVTRRPLGQGRGLGSAPADTTLGGGPTSPAPAPARAD